MQNNLGVRYPPDQKGVCEFCKVSTDDWIVFDGARGTCKCRRCYYTIVYPKPEGMTPLHETRPSTEGRVYDSSEIKF
jgi:hypothetical protein